MESTERQRYFIISILLVVLALAALLHQAIIGEAPLLRSILKSFEGFISLQTKPARLINDFTLSSGVGGAYLNAAIMGTLTLLIIRVNGVRLSGPTVAAILTIVGFSLFGKTPLNTAPIILGVYLAGRIVKKPFKNYLLIALFGTAGGPIFSFIFAESGLSPMVALGAAAAAGIVFGMVLPSAAMAMLRMHEGFNLYNIGLTVGFLSLFAASIKRAANADMAIEVLWNSNPDPVLIATPFVLSVMLIAAGLWMATPQSREQLPQQFRKIYRMSGRLPSDFMDLGRDPAALINAGILGLIASVYLAVVGADFNGPVIGAVFTLVGFGTFGKHVKNSVPVMLGVAAATLLSGKSLTAPGPVLALIFSTTLAPLSGEFGMIIGFLAGMTHLVMVEQTAAWHGGLNLYNNGFAGGLTATLFVAVIQWFRANRE
jgi:hypothetical protein